MSDKKAKAETINPSGNSETEEVQKCLASLQAKISDDLLTEEELDVQVERLNGQMEVIKEQMEEIIQKLLSMIRADRSEDYNTYRANQGEL